MIDFHVEGVDRVYETRYEWHAENDRDKAVNNRDRVRAG